MQIKNYLRKLEESAKENNSILCMGIDPILEKIPIKEKDIEKKIVKFYSSILNAVRASKKARIAAVKPNYAFFAQYGFPGLRALKKIIEIFKKHHIVLLDAKRADIGNTSMAYAKEMFDFWKVDSVTVNTYLGYDSLEPFFEYCKKGRGVYVLVRTSNNGGADFQNLIIGNEPLYMKVAKSIVQWNIQGVGAVIGAPSIEEFKELANFFNKQKLRVPFLIPGIGKQGGSAAEITKILKENKKNILLHRISASSSINYAYEQTNTRDYADAAVKAIKQLNEEIKIDL